MSWPFNIYTPRSCLKFWEYRVCCETDSPGPLCSNKSVTVKANFTDTCLNWWSLGTIVWKCIEYGLNLNCYSIFGFIMKMPSNEYRCYSSLDPFEMWVDFENVFLNVDTFLLELRREKHQYQVPLDLPYVRFWLIHFHTCRLLCGKIC